MTRYPEKIIMPTNDRSSAEYQRNVSDFVRREGIYCVSTLVSEALGKGEDAPEYDELLCLVEPEPDWQEAAEDHGWTITNDADGNFYGIEADQFESVVFTVNANLPTPSYFWYEALDSSNDRRGPFTGRAEAEQDVLCELGVFLSASDETDAYRELCEDQGIDGDGYRREVYEHWIVSGWLADRLGERGEVVGEWCGLTIWGRCTTGQAISMDGVICSIYDELHSSTTGKEG